jgi:hypothetical protein
VNEKLGTVQGNIGVSESHRWILDHPDWLDTVFQAERLRYWQEMSSLQASELVLLLHLYGSDPMLAEVATFQDLYASPGPNFDYGNAYGSQAEIALIGLSARNNPKLGMHGFDMAFLQILRTLSRQKTDPSTAEPFYRLPRILRVDKETLLPHDMTTWPEFSALAQGLTARLARVNTSNSRRAITY